MKKRDAIAAFGSASDLARALGITRQSVSDWGEDIPELRAYQIREILEQRRQEEEDAQWGYPV
jgi:biotin operon repressor